MIIQPILPSWIPAFARCCLGFCDGSKRRAEQRSVSRLYSVKSLSIYNTLSLLLFYGTSGHELVSWNHGPGFRRGRRADRFAQERSDGSIRRPLHPPPPLLLSGGGRNPCLPWAPAFPGVGEKGAPGPAKERNCALASTMRLTIANRSKLLRASRSIRVTVTTSRGRACRPSG